MLVFPTGNDAHRGERAEMEKPPGCSNSKAASSG
jgi:hypothetical protein